MMVLAPDHVIVNDLLGDIFVTVLVAPSEARNDPDSPDSLHSVPRPHYIYSARFDVRPPVPVDYGWEVI